LWLKHPPNNLRDVEQTLAQRSRNQTDEAATKDHKDRKEILPAFNFVPV
jgi:hypothetical protein